MLHWAVVCTTVPFCQDLGELKSFMNTGSLVSKSLCLAWWSLVCFDVLASVSPDFQCLYYEVRLSSQLSLYQQLYRCNSCWRVWCCSVFEQKTWLLVLHISFFQLLYPFFEGSNCSLRREEILKFRTSEIGTIVADDGYWETMGREDSSTSLRWRPMLYFA